jgi:ABC-type nitrate/sulfonate/bicarbonate transport system substrate-binding protein
MNKTLISVLTLLIYWGWVLGRSAAQASNKITIGYASMSTVVTTLWVARDEGFLAKNNIDAELVFVPGSPILLAALNSGDIQLGYGGGPASLGAAARGLDVKILAAFSNRSGNDFVVRPEIKKPQDLRGKRIGVTAVGGTGWMGAVLVLEQLGLNPERDHIQISGFGDQRVISQALEVGTIDAALVTAVFTLRLKRLGYRILGELDRIPLVGSSIIVKKAYLNSHAGIVKDVLRGLIEGHAFVFDPSNRAAVMKTIMKRLGIADTTAAEVGLQDYIRRVDRKPYPLVEGLRNVQRLMKLSNPAVAKVKVEELIDDSLFRDIENSGFLDRVYRGISEAR